MRNRKLYESVQKLVKETQTKKADKKNFVEEYCQGQLLRKRLIPRDTKTKINDMKVKFKGIQTYVDVENLVSCINEIHKEQIKLKHQEDETNHNADIKAKQVKKYQRFLSESENTGREVLNKANNMIKKYYSSHCQFEKEQMVRLIKVMETQSTCWGDKIKNTPMNDLYKMQKRNKFEETEKSGKENWNYYHDACEKFEAKNKIEQVCEASPWKKIDEPTDLYRKRRKMFQLARIYLHMILEDEHRKKWKTQNKRSQPKINHRKTHEALKKMEPVALKRKGSSFRKSVTKDVLNVEQKKIKVSFSDDPQPKQTHNIYSNPSEKKLKKTQRKIFLPNNRQQAIKKLQLFIQELDENEREQKILKRSQKRIYNKYEEQLQEDRQKSKKFIFTDEDQVIELQTALIRHENKSLASSKKKIK